MEEPSAAETTFEERNDVYIGNMPFDLEESDLKDMVSSALSGDAASDSVRIIRDRDTGRSRGFGYISFDTKEEAEASVAKLEGLSANGRDFRVNVSVPKDQRAPRERKPREQREMGPSIFMGNLDFSVQDGDVQDLCDEMLGPGVVKRVRIATDRDTGRSRGFGHLDFETQEQADEALEKLAGSELSGRPLRVDIAQRKEDRPRRVQSKHSVFIGNLSWDIDTTFVEDMIDDILGPGSFAAVRLATDNQTGRIRGFGHVDFKDAETAARAVVELNGMEVLGRQLRVDHAEKKF
jgi:nucleolin